jgi:hypothetical protein
MDLYGDEWGRKGATLSDKTGALIVAGDEDTAGGV